MEQVPHGEVEGVQRGALAMNVVGHGDALAWHAERQALGMVQNLLQLAKLDWPVLDCSTVCRRQKTLQVELSSLRTKSPLQLLVDITGIKFLGEGEWKREKHGADSRRAWRKVHWGIDAQTLEIRAIEVTSNAIGVALMLPELLTQIATDECGLGAPQRRHSRVQALGSQHLEEVERLPPAQPCGDKDALLQAAG